MQINPKGYNLFDFIRIPWGSGPVLTALKIIDKIIFALIPSFTVIVSANIINIALAIFNGTQVRNNIYLPLFLLMLLGVYQYIDLTIMNLVSIKLGMRLNEQFRQAVVEKRAKLEYGYIENNESWEIINRTCSDPAGRIYKGFDILLYIIGLVVRVVSILVILFSQVWWAGIVIILFSIPLFCVSLESGKTNYEASKEAAKHERKAAYLHEVLTSRENVEERSMFSYTNNISEKWYDKYEIARKIRLKVQAKNHIRMRVSSLTTILISLIITAVLLVPLGNGTLSIGMFMSLVTASFSLVQMMAWELGYVTSEMSNNREYLKDLNAFSMLSEQGGALDAPAKNNGITFKSLEFKNVSFKYPGTEKYILMHCSFNISANAKVAFVGINGAGKTTITKLITGLYPDFDGEILINGKNIKKFSQAQLKALFSIVYQDFAKYYISFRDNATLGNIHGVSDEKIKNEAELIGLDKFVDKLPNGLDTFLGKIKSNAVDLSGGEWQRLAILRSLVSGSPVSVLDEPTAALDPVAESNVYEIFARIAAQKTTIFITHRLGAAKLGDEIFVIDGGKVAEHGSHTKLMGDNGIYAKMYEAQRSWYE